MIAFVASCLQTPGTRPLRRKSSQVSVLNLERQDLVIRDLQNDVDSLTFVFVPSVIALLIG